ncbi:GABA transporter 1-like [Durio zibethinus]|uniref:GABA transporter 1-like n=1 Tax=Durio zibethinus TaxID=66656 RepID=A0A6P5ZLS4_DURZI|nr:GABA transporter 1-like [Durio zibethinus]
MVHLDDKYLHHSPTISSWCGENIPSISPYLFHYSHIWFIHSVMWFLSQVYLQPTNEVLETTFTDPNFNEFSARNVIPRVVSRSFSVVIATTIAAMLPFFGDINSVIGAFGFLPVDFVLPVVFFSLTFKPSKRSPIFWLNMTITMVFSAVGVIAAVAAVRQISIDATTYRLFANI